MKAIMISDHAKWCALMMNGDKTIEVRKGTALYKAIQKLIDEYGYADIYVYCTKDEELFYDTKNKKWLTMKNRRNCPRLSNGMVVFKFRCYNVEEIYYECGNNGISVDGYKWFYTEELDLVQDFEKATCLNEYELFNYLQPKEANGTPCGYAIHISDLEIFDKPKELSEFFKCDGKPNYALFGSSHYELANRRIIKAPQSWCYIEVE